MRTGKMLALALITGAALAPAALAQDASPPPDEPTLRAHVEAAQGKEKAAAAAQLATLLEGESRWSEAASAWRQARRLRGDVADLEGEARTLGAFAEDVIAQGETGSAVTAAFEDARTALRRAREAGSKSLDVALGLARCAEISGDADARIAELRAACASFPADARAQQAFAEALIDAGKSQEALALYTQLSQAQPASVELALRLYAVAKAAADEPAQRAAADRAIAASPDDARGWSALWKLYSAKQRWGELADAAVAVARKAPDSVFAAHYAGIACATARRFDEALEWLEKAWTKQPSDSTARLESARILWTEKHDRTGSQRLYSYVMTADPGNQGAADGLFWIAKRLSDEGDRVGAVPIFETIAKARPQDTAAQGNYANSLRFAGRYDESERAFLASIATSPGDAQLRNDYALLLEVVGRTEDSRKVLLAAHDADPANNDSMENLAFLARASGDRDAALHWFRMAHAALLAKGEDGRKHRINIDDQRYPLPPVR